jgi:hypothetical protein
MNGALPMRFRLARSVLVASRQLRMGAPAPKVYWRPAKSARGGNYFRGRSGGCSLPLQPQGSQLRLRDRDVRVSQRDQHGVHVAGFADSIEPLARTEDTNLCCL